MSLTPRLDRLEINKIINGNFDFWQRGTTLTGITASGTSYLADRFSFFRNTAATIRMDRDTDVPTQSESGFKSTYSLKLECTSSGALNTSYNIFYNIEGYDWASMFNKKLVISFWAKASVTGDYGVALRNNVDRSFADVITINSADTWEKKTIVVPADAAGTHSFDNTLGMQLVITLGNASAGNIHGNLGGWESSSAVTSNTQVDLLSTIGNTFRISQVMATTAEQELESFVRAGRAISDELSLCQRYYRKSYALETAPGTGTSDGQISISFTALGQRRTGASVSFEQAMRVTPTIRVFDTSAGGVTPRMQVDNNGSVSADIITATEKGFGALTTSTLASSGSSMSFQYDADADFT